MIKISSLTKCFDNKARVLDCTDMHVKEGSVYGLVGVNGSGKTTIIKHIMGILKQDSGTVEVIGEDVFENNKIKGQMAYVPDDLFFYNSYSMHDMAKQYDSYYPNWSWAFYNQLVKDFNLNDKQRLNSFSKGMQKQACFILAMSSMPKILVLDEPIDGLDPIVRRKVWSLVMDQVADRKMTVLVSSHNLREMEGVCDTIGIMKNGRLIIEREIDVLKTDINKVQVAFKEEVYDPFEGLNVIHHEMRGSVHLVVIRNDYEMIEAVLNKKNPAILDVLPLTLEEIFIYELGGKENDGLY